MRLLLDTGVLGQICHPRKYGDARAWFRRAVAEHELLLSEFADYELRRELLRIDSRRSLRRLDELTRELQYVPVTTATKVQSRRPLGRPTDVTRPNRARSASARAQLAAGRDHEDRL